jgi:CheY-like chemotaxis protein
MTATLDVPKRLSVVEDEPDLVASLERSLKRRGYEVTTVVPSTPQLEDAIAEVMAVSDATLCDHALRGGLNVRFSGAELVAALTERGFPAVLFTGVLPEERYAIRRNMAHIPGFLHREDGLRPATVLSALTESINEVRGGRPPPRRLARRTPVTVVGTRSTGPELLVALSISGWPGETPVEVPADLLPEPWRHHPREAEGKTFLARVNIGEEDEDRLFLRDFEPEPVETDRFVDAIDR